VDVIVRGEGEIIFLRLVQALESSNPSESLQTVDGISYVSRDNYCRNKDAAPPETLDELPFPARDLFELKMYKGRLGERPLANLITSRGCPYNCYFCSSSRFGGTKWRYRSARSIAEEMQMLYNDYGYRTFSFMDDNFTISKERILQLADEIENRGMTDIKWWCFSRVDILLKHEVGFGPRNFLKVKKEKIDIFFENFSVPSVIF
jgi:radical SAM superfamily enzyme YgiQ (UPF0313 family)